MKTKLIVLLISCSTFAAYSQGAITKNVQHRLGLHAGTTSGLGLSYKAVIKDKYEIQLTTLPFASKNDKFIFSGVNLGYKFSNNKVMDFLLLVSASNNYESYTNEGYTYYDYSGYTVVEPSTTVTTNKFNSSLGLGFQLGATEVFKLNFQVGYGLYDMFSANWRTLPSIGIGFDFRLARNN